MHKTSPRLSPSTSSPLNGRDKAFPLDYEDGDAADEYVIPGEHYTNAPENLEERVQTTQNRLAQLRVEAEALEREKLQFEELSRKQKDFMNGRGEMGEKLTRALSHLDRETYEAQKRVEQLLVIKDTFAHQLDVVESLNPEEWNSHDLQHDLNRALGLIDAAREEYVKGSARVHQLTAGAAPAAAQAVSAPAKDAHAPPSASAPAAAGMAAAPVSGGALPTAMNRDTFRFWVFCGLGLSLPLAVVSFVIFVLWLIAR